MAQRTAKQYSGGAIAAIDKRLYQGTSEAAGIALIAPAAGGGHPTLWNQSDSDVNVFIRSLTIGYVSGNNAPTNIIWALTEGTGSAVATGAPVVTFTTNTAGTIKKDVLGGRGEVGSGKVLWSGKTNTFTAAPAFFAPTGLSLFTGVAATAVAPFMLHIEYDGSVAIAPGAALSLCTTAATTTSLLLVRVVWEELPVTIGASACTN